MTGSPGCRTLPALDVDRIRIEPGDGTGVPWELYRTGIGPLYVT